MKIWVTALFWFGVAASAAMPLLPRKAQPVREANAFTWPTELVAPDWQAQPLAEREARFAREFPGEIAVFATPDGRTMVARRVLRPTRKLHPAADCLRAVGYTIEARPIYTAADGVEWGVCEATRGRERLRVRERLLGQDGRRWTDASAWFWAAAFGRASGPWWAITELAPLPNEEGGPR